MKSISLTSKILNLARKRLTWHHLGKTALETFVRTNKISGRLEERLQRRLKNIEPIINDKLEYFAKSNFSKLGKLTTQASKYMKKEWQAMNRILQDENLEISNNLDERMMRRIKLNLKTA